MSIYDLPSFPKPIHMPKPKFFTTVGYISPV